MYADDSHFEREMKVATYQMRYLEFLFLSLIILLSLLFDLIFMITF